MAIQGLPGAGLMFPQGPVPLGGAQDTGASKGDPALPGVGPAGEALLHNRPLARQQLAENPEARARFARATRGTSPNQAIVIDARNAIEILAGLLEAYGRTRMKEAEEKITKNQNMSRLMATMNLKWGQIKGYFGGAGGQKVDAQSPWRQNAIFAKTDRKVGDGSNKDTQWAFETDVHDGDNKTGDGLTCDMYHALTRLHAMSPGSSFYDESYDGSEDLTPEIYYEKHTRKQFLAEIFPGGDNVGARKPDDTDRHFKISSNDLREAAAIVTAFSDGFQAEVDKRNQEFKNCMTLLNSAREEVKDLRRELLSLGKR